MFESNSQHTTAAKLRKLDLQTNHNFVLIPMNNYFINVGDKGHRHTPWSYIIIHKSAGIDQILAEFIQAGHNTLCSEIHIPDGSVRNNEKLAQQ
jgi:hypothetical protein